MFLLNENMHLHKTTQYIENVKYLLLLITSFYDFSSLECSSFCVSYTSTNDSTEYVANKALLVVKLY